MCRWRCASWGCRGGRCWSCAVQKGSAGGWLHSLNLGCHRSASQSHLLPPGIPPLQMSATVHCQHDNRFRSPPTVCLSSSCDAGRQGSHMIQVKATIRVVSRWVCALLLCTSVAVAIHGLSRAPPMPSLNILRCCARCRMIRSPVSPPSKRPPDPARAH